MRRYRFLTSAPRLNAANCPAFRRYGNFGERLRAMPDSLVVSRLAKVHCLHPNGRSEAEDGCPIGNELTQRRSSADSSRLFALIAGVVAVATLYFARAVLIPFALAMLVSFLLTPLVRLLEKLRLPRVAAVLLAVILAMAAAVFVAVKVTNQLVDVTAQLPNLSSKFRQQNSLSA